MGLEERPPENRCVAPPYIILAAQVYFSKAVNSAEGPGGSGVVKKSVIAPQGVSRRPLSSTNAQFSA